MNYSPSELLHIFPFFGLSFGMVVFASCYTLMQVLYFFKAGSK